MSREEQFDFYWKEIFDGLAYNPIEFNVYRFDQSMSLPSKFNKLYEMLKVLAMNNQEVMDYLKAFVETFDFTLETTVSDVLNHWLTEGLLSELVREAINEEVVQARTSKEKTYSNLKERLDDSDQKIKVNENKITDLEIKTNGYIALSEWCKDTTGSTDVTDDFLIALEYAKTNRKSILVDGVFKISQPFSIRNEIPEVFGNTRTRSRLLFTGIPSVYCITLGSYYTQQNLFRDLSIECIDGTCDNGIIIKSDVGNWGYKADFENVSITGFRKNLVKYFNAYNVAFTNCVLTGYTTGEFPTQELYTTLLVSESDSSSNLHRFTNTLFLNGRVGIHTIGGGSIQFNSCTFENLTLFLNTESRVIGSEPDKSHYLSFIDNWLERVTHGIVNAKLATNSISPIEPIVNKSPIDKYIKMFNNKPVWGVVEYPLSLTVNGAERVNFKWENGYELPIKRKSWQPLTLNGNWIGTAEYKYLETGEVLLRGSVKPTQATGSGTITDLPFLPRYNHPILVIDNSAPIVKPELSFLVTVGGKLNPNFGTTYDIAKTYNFSTMYTVV